jgi:ATP-dependent Clp protease ATP-binding subunit ClpC
VFARFTDHARQAIVMAQDESRRLRHRYLGTEHVLLGLLREGDPTVVEVLAPYGIELEAARSLVHERVPERGEAPVTMPFTPEAKAVLEQSLREAKRLGNSSIDAGHLLLGLIHDKGGTAVEILDSLGVDVEAVRTATRQALATGTFTRPPSPPSRGDRLTEIERRLDSIETLLARVLERLEDGSGRGSA